jgi:hypothetical protein
MSEGQVSQKIIHHMHADHGLNVIPADFMIKIKHSIKNQNFIDTVNPARNEPLLVK